MMLHSLYVIINRKNKTKLKFNQIILDFYEVVYVNVFFSDVFFCGCEKILNFSSSNCNKNCTGGPMSYYPRYNFEFFLKL